MLRLIFLSFLAAASLPSVSYAAKVKPPVEDDRRIKTLVYDEEKIFKLTTAYGLQSSIEFEKGESVDTISMGDSVGWQVTPAGRRVFIKPLQDGLFTNMTIITTRRIYQFDLESRPYSKGKKDPGISYLVKFTYADMSAGAMRFASEPARQAAPVMPVMPQPLPPAAAPRPLRPLPPQASSLPPIPKSFSQQKNFNYTLTGSPELEPLKIFDDGSSTFFKFKDGMKASPSFMAMGAGGSVVPVIARKSGGYMIVDRIAQGFKISSGSEEVTVYNENLSKTAKN